VNLHSLTLTNQRIIAVGLLALLALILTVFVIHPQVSAISAKRAKVAQQSLEYSRWQAILDGGDETSRQFQIVQQDPRLQAGLLRASTDSQSSAAVQSSLNRIMAASNVQVRSTVALTPQSEGGLRQVGVKFSAVMTNEQLNDVLVRLAEYSPELFVRSASIKALPSAQQRTEGFVPPELAVQFEVIAYARADER